MTKKEKLFLIDGNSYCYRAFYAIKELRNSKGKPTNAVYGFILMLKKLLEKEKPAYLAVAFDLKGPTFRHKQFEDYKAHRKPMPDDLASQMDLIKEVICAYRIPIFEKQGFEADDILATVAKKISQQDVDVYIVTGDKDMLQMVNEHIKVYSTHKDDLVYDDETVRERFSGLGPENITDFIALAGDASDNIPGVRGIGEKTAIELIKEFGSVDNLYKNLDKLKSESRRKMLAEQEDSARMSKELATVDTDASIEIDINDMRLKNPDSERLLGIFKELEFKTFAREIASTNSEVHKEACYKTISSPEGFKDFIAGLKKQKEFVLDIETTSEQPMEAELVGISFCWKQGEAYYVSLSDIANALKELKPIFEDEDVKKIWQNIKYDKLVLSNYCIEVKGISFDTMIASYLLNPSRMSHGLDDLAFEYLDHKMTPISELLGAGQKRVTMDMVDVEKVSMYSCGDSDVTLRLKDIFEKEILIKELESLFRDIELPLIDVLSDMEKSGIKIDTGFLKEASIDMAAELSKLIKDIYRLAGAEFNINSPKQLSQILFEKLGL